MREGLGLSEVKRWLLGCVGAAWNWSCTSYVRANNPVKRGSLTRDTRNRALNFSIRLAHSRKGNYTSPWHPLETSRAICWNKSQCALSSKIRRQKGSSWMWMKIFSKCPIDLVPKVSAATRIKRFSTAGTRRRCSRSRRSRVLKKRSSWQRQRQEKESWPE